MVPFAHGSGTGSPERPGRAARGSAYSSTITVPFMPAISWGTQK
jgi:hypothetical protein